MAFLPERLRSVLVVLYLVSNEGYAATACTDLVRYDRCEEAIRLGKLLAVCMPDEAEALGLLSLMLLQDSRRAARVGQSGGACSGERCRCDGPGPYQLQATIAAAHAEDRRARATTNGSESRFLEQRLAEVS